MYRTVIATVVIGFTGLRSSAWTQTGCAPAADATTVRASVSASGVMGNGTSFRPTISANGRWVAFESVATNLVPPDTNPFSDVFVRDMRTGVTKRISVSWNGGLPYLGGSSPTMSPDGRFVAFGSGDSTLVQNDVNGAADVFVHDRKHSITRLASLSTAGVQGNDQSTAPRLSSDGRFVTFNSLASTLALGDSNGFSDAFVHDQLTGETQLVSLSSSDQQGNYHSFTSDISGDGRYVAFGSFASNLVPGDTNGFTDTFVRDRWTSTTMRVSVSSSGQQGNEESGVASWGDSNPAISGDGRYVAFVSTAQNLVPNYASSWQSIFVHDRWTGTTTLVSKSSTGVQGNDRSERPSFSAGGRFVTFSSYATNLVAGGTSGSQIFLHDLWSATTERVSFAWNGSGTGVLGRYPTLSADGRWAAFSGFGPLVQGPANVWSDIYVRQRDLAAPLHYCVPKPNSSGCEPSIAYSGAPSATSGSGFHVTVSDILPGRNGSLAYSIGGAHNAPFLGGTLCVRPPLRFTPTQQASGQPWPPDCSGTYDTDFNGFVATSNDPGLLAGAQVWVQYIARDPGFMRPDSIALSDALTFVLCP